jgi:hypothetical protein
MPVTGAQGICRCRQQESTTKRRRLNATGQPNLNVSDKYPKQQHYDLGELAVLLGRNAGILSAVEMRAQSTSPSPTLPTDDMESRRPDSCLGRPSMRSRWSRCATGPCYA